ncbi:MAG: AGE family epimerase/isomerase [Ancrocorticia sp.]|jgi:sulfoquinovose isomerase|nr:AGE family epimerase/isomerase [Ancrocorticia sp.]MCI1963690.1 AGE family epimerase/isomerase [Ancrocorticia sp.]MCI2002721.1 AGE family epimerase/isomerase [Ancrocorticia sp.]MCI2012041.1 AGE family epimerase/isomerase [Ancrocorticia sp.]MCI2029439.1 AGE family epimerase/isomerase [Ancrocorticia sp.]
MNWLTTAAHMRWLEAESDRLFTFGAAARDPQGGFGWLDDSGAIDQQHDIELWITCRMTHSYALATMMGRPGASALADHGIAALNGTLHDQQYGGWFAAVGPNQPNDAKEAYGHAFVILAAASAAAAGRPGARPLLDRALSVHTERFWDPKAGMSRESFNRDWSEKEDYRGINANMHTVEAYLAAADVLGEVEYLERAWRIISTAVHQFARQNNWHMPEHFSGSWEPLLDYNKDTPAHPFRPYGATIGHSFEWARLTLQAAAQLQRTGLPVPDWAVPDARALYDAGVRDGWHADGADGFVYTVDWDGTPVVRERMHWVVAEAIDAAAVLWQVIHDSTYARQYQTWWDYAARYLIDPRGSWRHEVGTDNGPSHTVWQGKPDIYHALQATLIPRLPVAPALAESLRSGNLG